MDREALLHSNCELWSRYEPKRALFLPCYKPDCLLFAQTEKGEPNLKNRESGELYHSEKGAVEGEKSWFEALDLGNSSVLYIYGVGLGYAYYAVKEWLKKDSERTVVFVEDDIEVLYHLFMTQAATDILEDKQVKLLFFEDFKEFDSAFGELYWDVILTQMTIVASPLYERIKNEAAEEIKHKIVYDSAIKNALVEEYLRYGASFHRNFFYNTLFLSDSWQGTHLFNQFEGVPAIICGAGPSLNKNLQQLPGLLGKAVVFGGGSALNALSSRDILPHFGIGVDPNPTQQYRLSSNKAYEVPFFYRNRVHFEAFRLIHGPRLYIPGAGGYEVADWFDDKFGLTEEWIDEGHNVVNFGIEIACRMGCNPILLMGVDLAFTEMQAYAKGVVDDTSVDIKAITETDDFDTSALLKEDIYGEPTYTLWKWIAEAEWISDYAKEHPDLTIINCTEGGLGMPEIENMPLKEAAEKYLKRNYDLQGRVQGEILSSALPEITEERVVAAMEELRESLARATKNIEELIKDNEQLQEKLQQEKRPQEITQSGLAALAETELAEECGYTHLLGLFNLVYSRVHNKEIHSLGSEERNLPEWEKQLKRAQVNHKRLSFLRDVARVNIHSMNGAITERLEQKTR